MNTLKFIDRFFGRFLSIIFGLFPRPSPHSKLTYVSTKLKTSGMEPRIAIIKPFGIGTLILAEPYVMALRGASGGNLTLITSPEVSSYAKHFQSFDRIITINFSDFRRAISSQLGLLYSFAKGEYDVILLFELFDFWSAIVSAFAFRSITVGFSAVSLRETNLIDYEVPFNSFVHVSDNYRNMIIYTIDLLQLPPMIDMPSSDSLRLERLGTQFEMVSKGSSGNQVPLHAKLVINPDAGNLSVERRWPLAHYTSLLYELLAMTDITVFITIIGTSSSLSYLTPLLSEFRSHPRVTSAVGKTSWIETVGLIKGCDLLLTSDTGPMHVAGALDIPIVSLWGPENPEIYAPRGSAVIALKSSVACSPCLSVYNSKTAWCNGNNICMTYITPLDVHHAIRFLLTTSRPTRIFNTIRVPLGASYFPSSIKRNQFLG